MKESKEGYMGGLRREKGKENDAVIVTKDMIKNIGRRVRG